MYPSSWKFRTPWNMEQVCQGKLVSCKIFLLGEDLFVDVELLLEKLGVGVYHSWIGCLSV